jgi:hypothetical protein
MLNHLKKLQSCCAVILQQSKDLNFCLRNLTLQRLCDFKNFSEGVQSKTKMLTFLLEKEKEKGS